MLFSSYLSYHTGFDPFLFEVYSFADRHKWKWTWSLIASSFSSLPPFWDLMFLVLQELFILHYIQVGAWDPSFFKQIFPSLLVTLLLQVKSNLKRWSFLFICICLDLKYRKFSSLNIRSKSLVSFVLKNPNFSHFYKYWSSVICMYF